MAEAIELATIRSQTNEGKSCQICFYCDEMENKRFYFVFF